ncbi:hypothetical protein [Krasilnikovia cinnamomea]|uniref:hypothetical protein n=1 Tax=Krasilnikovia cinnamomea TaxID=349313 RepID=UPI00102C5A12|nr:hypothetical protein [Krasilnikovia cinnamomea]
MRIPGKFNGPPASGNGGWSAGAFAVASGAAADGRAFEVTLRIPPPLDTELAVADGKVTAPDGTLVAEVTETADAGPGVPAASLAEAQAAAKAYPGFTDHPFPTCYVCGPHHRDGLRIFPGLLSDERTAAPWTVPPDVRVETMWAALDCPGGWSALHIGRVYVLGRIAVAVDALPQPGATCVVVGRASALRGRKATVDSTVYGPDGARLATAHATWIALSDE